jgi:hypothetical protein
LRELSGSELLFPSGLDLLDGFADRSDHGVSFGCEVHALGALVAFVGFAGEVSELLELAEEVVEPRSSLASPLGDNQLCAAAHRSRSEGLARALADPTIAPRLLLSIIATLWRRARREA